MSQTQTHTDSLDGIDNDTDVQKKKSRRPASTWHFAISPRPYAFDRQHCVDGVLEHVLKSEHRHRFPAAEIESMAVSICNNRYVMAAPRT